MQDWQLTKPAHLTIPARAARSLINERAGDALLLYFHMQLAGGRLNGKGAMEELDLTADQLNSALHTLQQLGLADVEGAAVRALQSEKRPDYSPDELTASLQRDNHFQQLTEDVSRKMGKILSNSDLATLLGLYTWLGLPADVISLLVVYCQTEHRRRMGTGGRGPTLRQIEKTAIEWEKQGLVTAERCEAWMVERERLQSTTAQLARAVQITGRVPTNSEEGYLQRWATMGLSPELVYEAYDRTVLRCGKMEWKYIDAILGNWHQKGLLTVDDVRGGDKKSTFDNAKDKRKTGQPGDFERLAVEQMRLLRQKKED